jgi:hypothetical protein
MLSFCITQKGRPPPPKAAHAPAGGIIPMTAHIPFYIFYKLELIKREKLNKLSISKK